MKLLERYEKLSPEWKNVVILACIGLIGAAASCFFILLPDIGIGAPLGFLAGSLTSILAYYSIVYMSRNLLKARHNASNAAKVVAFMLARYVLYGAVLFLAAMCTFRWYNHFFNFWFVFAGMMPLYPVLIIASLRRNHKEEKAKPVVEAKAEEPKEEKEEDYVA